MDLRQLNYFVHVVDAQGFSGAAITLNLAQSTLSRQIALLEADFGQRLLVRTGRGAAPTEAGAALLAHARVILLTAEQARNELRDLQASPGGKLTVGLPPRVALGLSAPLVRSFRAQFPRASIAVSEGMSQHLREWLIAGRLDLALLFNPPVSPQLSFQTLMRESLLLVGPARAAKLPRQISLANLADYPMVVPSAPNAIRSSIDAALQPSRIQLQIVAEVGAVQTMLTLVSQGVGYTILPESAIAFAGDAIKALQHATIGPPRIQNNLVLAISRARPLTRLARETAELLKSLDFRAQAPR